MDTLNELYQARLEKFHKGRDAQSTGSAAATEPSTREEIESVLKARIEADAAETGLYDTGLWFVVVDRVNGEFTFQWFDSPMQLSDVLRA